MSTTPANRLAARLNAAHLVALALVAGMIATTGLTAAIAFPTMRDLQPTLGIYPDFGGEHAPLAAGTVMQKVFRLAGAAQFFLIGAASVTLTLAGTIANPHGGLARARVWQVRTLITLAVLGTLFAQNTVQRGMNRSLAAYHAAASAGDDAQAQEFRQRFADRHPTTSRLLTAALLLSVAGLAMGVWDAGRSKDGAAAP
ncbi:MAG: hypothetical protein KF684_09190 [Phycisphaeraceae bacterium]|nr:hypothetical protein [Phycisphaeraceae bacterium]